MKYLDLDNARELGIFQEINRLLLHPRGLALAIQVDDEGEIPTKAITLLNYRDDPEGVIFDYDSLPPQVAAAKAELFEKLILPKREKLLGFVVQPIPHQVRDGSRPEG